MEETIDAEQVERLRTSTRSVHRPWIVSSPQMHLHLWSTPSRMRDRDILPDLRALVGTWDDFNLDDGMPELFGMFPASTCVGIASAVNVRRWPHRPITRFRHSGASKAFHGPTQRHPNGRVCLSEMGLGMARW